MPTQRRNRQRKNRRNSQRRNSQRRNRKNLQRGGITLFGFTVPGTEDAERKKRDAELLAKAKNNNNLKAINLLGLQNNTNLASKPTNTADDLSQINGNFVEPNAGETHNKDNEVSKSSFPGGKQKKSIKKNKKSNKKR